MVSYKSRPTAKDFIQVEIIVEKNSQKIIIIGRVSMAMEKLFFLIVQKLPKFMCVTLYLRKSEISIVSTFGA